MKKPAGAKGRRAEVPEAVPAAVVRDLVDRNEQTIEQLRQELAKELRAAEEAELRVAVLSGDARSVPSDGGAPGPGGGSAGRPRTTVVTRPRPQGAG
ncbi:MAG: hypothetical protein ABSC41_04770 [Acidimicrobiales bacterium]